MKLKKKRIPNQDYNPDWYEKSEYELGYSDNGEWKKECTLHYQGIKRG